jgi:hypothetical protein
MRKPKSLIPFAMSLAFLALNCASVALAAGPSNAQERAAESFLRAVASGNAQAVAQELHPDELS